MNLTLGDIDAYCEATLGCQEQKSSVVSGKERHTKGLTPLIEWLVGWITDLLTEHF